MMIIYNLIIGCKKLFLGLITLLLLVNPLLAFGAKPVCLVADAKGDVRYRAAHSLNWQKLGDTKELYAGDQVFTRSGATIRLEYIFGQATVTLPPHTLFRISDQPPTYSKLRRRFGLENINIEKKLSGNTAESKTRNPFERIFSRKVIKDHQNEEHQSEDHQTVQSSQPVQLGIAREIKRLKLEIPKPNSIFIASRFPASFALRVNQAFKGQKIWAYVWEKQDHVNPIWSGYSAGEFASISIPKPGVYEVQAMSEDESLISEVVLVDFQQAEKSLNETMKQLNDKRDEDYTILVE